MRPFSWLIANAAITRMRKRQQPLLIGDTLQQAGKLLLLIGGKRGQKHALVCTGDPAQRRQRNLPCLSQAKGIIASVRLVRPPLDQPFRLQFVDESDKPARQRA